MIEYIVINQYYTVPVIRNFDCRYCGKHIDIFSREDKRVVFCSCYCEKTYWRKKSKENHKTKKTQLFCRSKRS